MIIDITEKLKERKLDSIKEEYYKILFESETLLNNLDDSNLLINNLQKTIKAIDLLEEEILLMEEKLNECLDLLRWYAKKHIICLF